VSINQSINQSSLIFFNMNAWKQAKETFTGFDKYVLSFK